MLAPAGGLRNWGRVQCAACSPVMWGFPVRGGVDVCGCGAVARAVRHGLTSGAHGPRMQRAARIMPQPGVRVKHALPASAPASDAPPDSANLLPAGFAYQMKHLRVAHLRAIIGRSRAWIAVQTRKGGLIVRQVIVYLGEDDYWVAECPSLPGCISQGRSREEALRNIKEAIRGYVAALEEDHLQVPEERLDALLVAV